MGYPNFPGIKGAPETGIHAGEQGALSGMPAAHFNRYSNSSR